MFDMGILDFDFLAEPLTVSSYLSNSQKLWSWRFSVTHDPWIKMFHNIFRDEFQF